jgi:SAM-dependent methyltransferase
VRNTIADYDRQGGAYAAIRSPDPAIKQLIEEQLGSARHVLNVGAGTGSYEPEQRHVVAIEPSATMRRQRARSLPPALVGVAASIPFDDDAFDAALGVLTVHHWPDLTAGLREVRRVTKGPVVLMTFDPDADTEFWMTDYVPEMAAVERARYPSMQAIARGLGGETKVIRVPVALACPDRFQVALYGRPEEFLREDVRRSQSAWNFLADGIETRFVQRLEHELASGAWDAKYGHLRSQPHINCQLRLVVATKANV